MYGAVIAAQAGSMGAYRNSMQKPKYKCTHCSQWSSLSEYSSEFELRMHVDSRHPKIKCKYPDCSYESRTDTESHYRSRHQTNCPVCSHLIDNNQLDHHLDEKHPVKSCEYSGCEHQYREANNSIHIQSVHQTWCPTCLIFLNKEDFEAHVSSLHPIMMCPSCPNYSSRHQSELDGHINTEHKIPCNLCQCRFWLNEFKAHLINRHQIDCSQCVHCHIEFSEGNEQQCVQHLISKHKIPCPYCCQTFVSEDLKIAHSKKEHPTCPSCSRVCYDQSDYAEHMQEHTVCEACSCSIM